MRTKPPSWVDPLMRVGYAARGIVYVLLGALAVVAAVAGGPAPDSKDALGALLVQPFGRIMLALIAAGLLCYSTWRFIDAGFDLEDKGGHAKGWLARGAQAASGLTHLLLAISAATSSWSGRKDGSDNTVSRTAALMAEPMGQWLVGAFGLVVIAFAVQHFVVAYQEKYKESLRYTAMAARLDPVVRYGLVAHGAVVSIIGVFFIWAAWTADPSHAGGLGEALNVVRGAEFGRPLLTLVAVGLLSFSVYCFIEAAYRIVPRCKPQDLDTLASKARSLQREAGRAVRNLGIPI